MPFRQTFTLEVPHGTRRHCPSTSNYPIQQFLVITPQPLPFGRRLVEVVKPMPDASFVDLQETWANAHSSTIETSRPQKFWQATRSWDAIPELIVLVAQSKLGDPRPCPGQPAAWFLQLTNCHKLLTDTPHFHLETKGFFGVCPDS